MPPSSPRQGGRIAILTNHPLSAPLIGALSARLSTVPVAVMDEEALLRGALSLLQVDLPIHSLNRAGMPWKEALATWLKDISAEALWVISFPHLLPPEILALPPAGCWNFHLGHLPRYRGPDPVFWEILNGEPAGALTIHRMESGFDAGPIFRSYPVPIGERETSGTHLRALESACRQGGLDLLEQASSTTLISSASKQDEGEAQFWPRPGLEDQLVRWELMSATRIDRLVRACNPFLNGAKASFRGKVFQVLVTRPAGTHSDLPSGTILEIDPSGVAVVCANGSVLKLHTVGTRDGLFAASDWARAEDLLIGQHLQP